MRMHISLTSGDLDASKAFYSAMFDRQPTMERDGYLQWLLDDPSVNFVVEAGGGEPGLSHLGVQALNEAELATQFARVERTTGPVFDQGETTCCFARSTKNWVTDPQGLRWESFLTHERTGDYGTATMPPVPAEEDSPCGCK